MRLKNLIRECLLEHINKNYLKLYELLMNKAFSIGNMAAYLYYKQALEDKTPVQLFTHFKDTNEYSQWITTNKSSIDNLNTRWQEIKKQRENKIRQSLYNKEIGNQLMKNEPEYFAAGNSLKMAPISFLGSDYIFQDDKLSPTIVKYRYRPTTNVQSNLLTLGIDPSLIYGVRVKERGIKYNPNTKVRGSFWNRNDEYYWNILELARRNYISKMRQLNPQTPTGDSEEARKVIAAWKFVEKSFGDRGYKLNNLKLSTR
jgi:hypothetical protein